MSGRSGPPDPKGPPVSVLNEHQRRRLAVRLGRLISEIQEMLTTLPPGPNSPVPQVSERRGALERELRALAARARETARMFAIETDTHEPDPNWRLQVWAAAWRMRVLDCRPGVLKGYGRVAPELYSSLGPAVEDLASRLSRIEMLAGGDGGAVDSAEPGAGSASGLGTAPPSND